MATKYVYFFFADGYFFAKAFSEDKALAIFQTMKDIFPEGTFFEMKVYVFEED
jgi:hypothetical protein